MVDRIEEVGAGASAGADRTRKVHPIVMLDYPVRIAAHLLVGIVMMSALRDDRPGVWIWIWLGFTGLIWPHLACLVARHSQDTKAAELRNLLADNVLIGAYAALSGFSPWPSVMMFAAIIAANLSIGGVPCALRGGLVAAIGSLVTLSLTGFEFEPDSSLLTTALSAGGLLLFNALLGLYSNLEARRALRGRREVEAKNLHIEEQRSEVQRARDLAERERAAADQARRLAEAANGAKSSFLANMSHELRTPLNAIIGYAEMLEEDIADPVQRADLQKIHGSGKHLLGLINDVLDLSKIEAGKAELHVEVFDVAQLVDQVVSTMRPLLDKNANRFELRLQEPLGVMSSDSTRLRQVLLNLLSNAAKFTLKGEVILAVRRETGERGGWLCFEVMDSGIGMTPEQLSRVFQPFVQADPSTTRNYGGTGLGLAISRRLCRMMGGDVLADSEAGHGTRFTMRVPAQAPEITAFGDLDDAVEPALAVPTTAMNATTGAASVPDARRAAVMPAAEEPWHEVPQALRIISQSLAAPAVFRVSPEGGFLKMNAATARLFGYASPEHLLSAVSDVGAHLFVSAPVWNEYRRRLLTDGVVKDFEYEARRSDGSTMWLSQDACAVRGDKGTLPRFECFAKDITALKRSCLALGQRLDDAVKARPQQAAEANAAALAFLPSFTPLAVGAAVAPADRLAVS